MAKLTLPFCPMGQHQIDAVHRSEQFDVFWRRVLRKLLIAA